MHLPLTPYRLPSYHPTTYHPTTLLLYYLQLTTLLLTTYYPTTYHPTTYYLPLYYILHTTYYLLLSTYYLPPYYLLLTTLQHTTYYLLLTTYYLTTLLLTTLLLTTLLLTTYHPTTYHPTTYHPTTYHPTTYYPTTYYSTTYYSTTYYPTTLLLTTLPLTTYHFPPHLIELYFVVTTIYLNFASCKEPPTARLTTPLHPKPMRKETLTLYELNQMVRDALAITMPDEYWVEAEISEMREVRGHCYMELVQKDAAGNTPVAKASAKCWKNKWAFLRPHFERNANQILRAGLKVRLLVYADFHEAYGFSWIVADIDPTYTLGDMARKRLEIVRTLKQQGVFDLQKDFRLPLFAQRVAVISSVQAAGYGDFYRHLHENEWHLQFSVQLFAATMQGEGVERSVIAALNAINERLADFDVVVIIRGGGATSDLSGFDSLPLAENVANFPLPIITGIGHDRDESVLDMVSFRRVKTPTAAAAFLVEHLAETYQRILDAQEEMVHLVQRRMELERIQLARLTEKVPMLFSLVRTRQEKRLENMALRMQNTITTTLQRQDLRLQRLTLSLPTHAERLLTKAAHRLELLEQAIKAHDPTLLLSKGYSITTHGGKVVRNANQLQKGDVIVTQLQKGKVKSVVE